MEKKMETTLMGHLGTTRRIRYFIPSWPKVSLVADDVMQRAALASSGVQCLAGRPLARLSSIHMALNGLPCELYSLGSRG